MTIKQYLFGTLVIVASVSSAHEVSDPKKFTSHSLHVFGKIKHELNLTADELKKMPSEKIENVAIKTKHGTHNVASYKGVLLKNILEKAEINAPNLGDFRKICIVASATDGYVALFSWNELFNSSLGEGVLVAYEKNQAALDDGEGEFLLVSTKDNMTGSRHVRWLKSIRVRKLSD